MRRLTRVIPACVALGGCAGTRAAGNSATQRQDHRRTRRRAAWRHIVITNEDTGSSAKSISTAEGTYFAPQMVPGRYRISAKIEGFKALDRREVDAHHRPDHDHSISTLEVGGLAETLTVTGEAPLVDVTPRQSAGTSRRPSSTTCRRLTATTWRLSATCRAPCSSRAPSS